MKNLVSIILFSFIIIMSTAHVLLAPPPQPEPIPFDGGLIALLLAIAGFFGGKKIFKKNKKK